VTSGETRPQDAGRTRPNPASSTRPTTAGDTQPIRPQPGGGPRKLGYWPWLLAGGVLAVVVLGVAAATGYMGGQQDRADEMATEQAGLLQEQFDLGVADLQNGRLQIARQRFEYILQIAPNYPNVHDLLDLTLQGLNQPTSTPIPSPTEIIYTPTPTLSVQSLDGLFAAAQTALSQQNWDQTVDLLLALRRKDPQYQLDQVNQMFFGALRNRGVNEILTGEQELGIYDLTLASRFGALDSQAASWERTAEFYLYANSYFGLDWQLAAANFSSLCGAGVWDSCYKYAVSAASYGDLLISKNKDYCAAVDQYDASLTTRDDKSLHPTATAAYEACQTATAQPATATPSITPTAGTPTIGIYTATPSATSVAGATATSTSTSAAAPSATPTATATQGATATFTLTPVPTDTPTQTPTP
jgi:tetratricopeptide (TPR) repeat protein